MKKLALFTLAAAALFATAGASSAQYNYSGPGYSPNVEQRYDESRYNRRERVRERNRHERVRERGRHERENEHEHERENERESER